MKKIIFLISLLASTSTFTQTVGGPPTSPIDSSNNPSSQAFGGAMGGANVPATPAPPTSPSHTQTSPSENRDMSVPRGTDIPQQSMEDRTNYAGGALGGSTRESGTAVPPTTSYPADTPVAPSVPKSSVELPRTNGTSTPETGIGNP